MPKGMCVFKDRWLSLDPYNDWLARVPENKNLARWKVCCPSFDVSSMGEGSLKSHARGAKHSRSVELCSNRANLDAFVRPAAASTSASDGVTVPSCQRWHNYKHCSFL